MSEPRALGAGGAARGRRSGGQRNWPGSGHRQVRNCGGLLSWGPLLVGAHIGPLYIPPSLVCPIVSDGRKRISSGRGAPGGIKRAQ